MMTDQSELIDSRIESVVKPLNNKVRLRILMLLAEAPLSYSEILEELQIESGSFYWHVKKMPGLIQQHADKKYSLTALGYRAYDLLVSEAAPVKEEEDPLWYRNVRNLLSPLLSSTALGLLLLLITTSLTLILGFIYSRNGYIQFGINVAQSEYTYSEFSVFISLLVISVLSIASVLYSRKIIGDGRIIRASDAMRYYGFANAGNLIAMLPGIMMLTVNPTMLLTERYATVVLSALFTFVSVVFLTVSTDVIFGFGYKNSLILILIIYYPVVLLSYALV